MLVSPFGGSPPTQYKYRRLATSGKGQRRTMEGPVCELQVRHTCAMTTCNRSTVGCRFLDVRLSFYNPPKGIQSDSCQVKLALKQASFRSRRPELGDLLPGTLDSRIRSGTWRQDNSYGKSLTMSYFLTAHGYSNRRRHMPRINDTTRDVPKAQLL